ncbi:Kinase [Hexamita inflata]|uniref:Kinase n=1 Tax=Hexamita inflata TaxID=28002 RepID=A0ABP1HMF1_9EUKA
MKLHVSNQKISYLQTYQQNYSQVKYLQQGSFATCFTAIDDNNQKVVLLVSDNIQELQTRLDIFQKLQDVNGVQQIQILQKLDILDSALCWLEIEYPRVFSNNSHILIGDYYETQYSDHMRSRPLLQKLDFFRDLLILVQHIHDKGVYHMDLKPSNIMVENGMPVLIDFGQSVTVTEVSSVLNTSAYAPKHDVYSCHVIPEKFDIYCLGSMLNEICTGQPLLYPMTPGFKQKIQKQIGCLASDLIDKMTQRVQSSRLSLEHCISHPLFIHQNDPDYQLINQFSDQILNYSFEEEEEEREPELRNSSQSFYSNSGTLCKTNTNVSLKDLFGNVVLSRICSCIILEELQ